MSIIQRIRDKGALISAIIIGVSLVGFLLMDAFAGKTGLFSGNGPGSDLGKVNGKSIDYLAFTQQVQEQENMARQRGYNIDESQRQQLIASLWEQEVANIIMADEYKKLGLEVTDKELRTGLITNPPDELRQRYTDESGNFNATAAQQEVNTMLKDEKQKEQIRNYLLMKKYSALISNSVNVPKWLLEKKNADNSLLATFSYVQIPYTTIDDKAVTVSDDEIQKYINDHKDQFEQKEESRNIDFVSISAAPTPADSAAIRSQLESIKGEFAATTDPGAFIQSKQSSISYSDAYVSKASITAADKDSMLAKGVGNVFGPFLQNESYVIGKIIDTKVLPDSVKCRHILLGTLNPQTGQAIMPDSIAKMKADSVAAAISAGASFDLLDSLYSTDEVAKKDKGVMTFSSDQIQSPNFAKEFGQFILFDGKTGDKKVLKTQFGWHYIEILDQKNISTHYKIAYIDRQIEPSEETEQQAASAASMFSGESRDAKSFAANYDKMLRAKQVLKSTATVHPMDYNISGIQAQARPLVKKIFEAKEGEVLSPERVGDDYVVALVTAVVEPGVPKAKDVRTAVEPYLINKKKAEQISKNIGSISTLEQVATKTGQAVQLADSIRFENPRMLGFEPKVIGAAFNPANKGKVVNQAIAGTQGVYVIRVDNVVTTPVDMNIEDQRRMMEAQQKQMMNPQYGGGPLQALKASANIKDNRHNFY